MGFWETVGIVVAIIVILAVGVGLVSYVLDKLAESFKH